MQFVIDGVNFGPVQTLVGGLASVSTYAVHAGPHTVSATYTSDSQTFANSLSTNVNQDVGRAVLTVTADNQSKVTGAAFPVLTASAAAS